MKKISLFLFCLWGLFCLGAPAAAAEIPEEPDGLYAASWRLPDGETLRMLEQLGLNGEDPASALGLSPAGIWDVLRQAFSASLPGVMRTTGTALCLLALLRVAGTFAPKGKTEELIAALGAAAVVFVLGAQIAAVVRSCETALRGTSDFILALLPVFVSSVALSGGPASALSLQGGALFFASSVSVLFSGVLPGLSAVSLALSAAGTLRGDSGCARAAGLLQKGVSLAAGGAAGLFVGYLSVKNLAAAAADTVAARGLRFFVGSAVPVVGSALGEALGAVTAGISTARTGIGVLGILTVALLNLFPLSSLLTWRIAAAFLGFAAELLGDARTAEFLKAAGGLFSMLTALVVFHAAVYVLSLAIVLKGG